jgi:hypothetical protein
MHKKRCQYTFDINNKLELIFFLKSAIINYDSFADTTSILNCVWSLYHPMAEMLFLLLLMC